MKNDYLHHQDQYLEPVIFKYDTNRSSDTEAILKLNTFFNTVEDNKPRTFSIKCQNIPKYSNPDGDANSQIKYVMHNVRKKSKERSCLFLSTSDDSLVYNCSPQSLPNVILNNTVTDRDPRQSIDYGIDWQYNLESGNDILKHLNELTQPKNVVNDFHTAYQLMDIKNFILSKKYKNENYDKCIQSDPISEESVLSSADEAANSDRLSSLTKDNTANYLYDVLHSYSQNSNKKNHIKSLNNTDGEHDVLAQQSRNDNLSPETSTTSKVMYFGSTQDRLAEPYIYNNCDRFKQISSDRLVCDSSDTKEAIKEKESFQLFTKNKSSEEIDENYYTDQVDEQPSSDNEVLNIDSLSSEISTISKHCFESIQGSLSDPVSYINSQEFKQNNSNSRLTNDSPGSSESITKKQKEAIQSLSKSKLIMRFLPQNVNTSESCEEIETCYTDLPAQNIISCESSEEIDNCYTDQLALNLDSCESRAEINCYEDQVGKQPCDENHSYASFPTMHGRKLALRDNTFCRDTNYIPRSNIFFQMNKRTNLIPEKRTFLKAVNPHSRKHLGNQSLDTIHLEHAKDKVLSSSGSVKIQFINYNQADNKDLSKLDVTYRNLKSSSFSERNSLSSLISSPVTSRDDVKVKRRNDFVGYLAKKFTSRNDL